MIIFYGHIPFQNPHRNPVRLAHIGYLVTFCILLVLLGHLTVYYAPNSVCFISVVVSFSGPVLVWTFLLNFNPSSVKQASCHDHRKGVARLILISFLSPQNDKLSDVNVRRELAVRKSSH